MPESRFDLVMGDGRARQEATSPSDRGVRTGCSAVERQPVGAESATALAAERRAAFLDFGFEARGPCVVSFLCVKRSMNARLEKAAAS